MTFSRRDFLKMATGVCGVASLDNAGGTGSAKASARASGKVGPNALDDKVLCGYQGWFRCPGDGTGRGWRHWSRNSSQITPKTLTFDMWPDLSEYSDKEKYLAPGFTHPDGKQAHLFSSAHPLTVYRHFEWMRDYGIDGVLLQRFVTGLGGDPSLNTVLANVRAAAQETGRVYAVEYDMSGMPGDGLERMVNDLFWLSKQGVFDDPGYLHHGGRPVVGVWGFFTSRFGPEVAHAILDAFETLGLFVIGGCQWWWRRETDPEWARAFRRFGAISPWNVGNVTTVGGERYAATGTWAEDQAEAQKAGMLFLPVIYPGFSWDNLQRLPPGTSLIPRLGGYFFWQQFEVASGLGLRAAKVAMFDEVDEATAVFKVTNMPPEQGYFVTYEDLPSDWYLALTGWGTQVLRGRP